MVEVNTRGVSKRQLRAMIEAQTSVFEQRRAKLKSCTHHNQKLRDILDKMQHRRDLYDLLRYEDYNRFDQALFNLYEDRQITFEDALRNADSVNDIRLRIKLESNTARQSGLVEDHRDFELEESDDDQAGGMI